MEAAIFGVFARFEQRMTPHTVRKGSRNLLLPLSHLHIHLWQQSWALDSLLLNIHAHICCTSYKFAYLKHCIKIKAHLFFSLFSPFIYLTQIVFSKGLL